MRRVLKFKELLKKKKGIKFFLEQCEQLRKLKNEEPIDFVFLTYRASLFSEEQLQEVNEKLEESIFAQEYMNTFRDKKQKKKI